MKVKPKLYLNMSPQTAEAGSLAFARNMKIDDDGNLVSDYGYKNIEGLSDKNIVGHIVGLDNKIYFFCHTLVEDTYQDEIVEYDEIEESCTTLNTHWTYNDGEIDGYVNTNQSGEKILTIAEYKTNGHVPLKHINLRFPKIVDNDENVVSNESIYSQAPECPTANLVLKDTYVKTIPNGVYVFFIRYKLRKDTYTNWFICSRPIFGGTSEKITTLQGGLNYINYHKDSAKSFVFQLDFAQISNKESYKEFQLGFIITHDEATDARTWKHFKMSDFVSRTPHYHEQGEADENMIYFDYENVKEANIDDLLETTYDLYNVRNVTAFKNKLYISNYIESNFNNLYGMTEAQIADMIPITEVHSGETKAAAKNMKFLNTELSYDYTKGYFNKGVNEETIASLLPVLYNTVFNYDVTNLAKGESKEKEEVLKFDIGWVSDNDPDLAPIYNIYNNLYNKSIFGEDYAVPYGNGRLGFTQVYAASGLWIFAPDPSNPHPWLAKNLTICYGSSSDNSYIDGTSRNGCWFFKNGTNTYYHPDDPDHHLGWPSHDQGFNDFARTAIADNIKKEIEGKSFAGRCYITISSGAKSYNIYYEARMDYDNYAGYDDDEHGIHDLYPISNEDFTTKSMNSNLEGIIEAYVYKAIKDKIVGIDESGSPVLLIEGETIRANSMSVVFKKFEFSVDHEDISTGERDFHKRYKITLKTTDYTSLCTFAIKDSCFTVTDSGVGAEQKSTLMPLSTYHIFAHFVDNHNIISNGIKIKTLTTGVATSNADVISLKYSLINVPTILQDKTFFLSIVNIGDIVMEGFSYTRDPNNPSTHIINCLEIDTLLYNINDNITIKVYDGSTLYTTITDARYYSSGSSYPALAFGNCGYVCWTDADATHNYVGKTFYIIVERNKSSENINELVKASSFIPLNVAAENKDVPDGYYGSWLSLVKKPDFGLSSSCYVSGNDVYATNRNTALSLTDFKSYIQVQNSVTYFIRSNFNLNYLSLSEDIPDKIFTIGSASSGVKQVARVINSAILSFIYELKPMYKDFTNKFFRRYDSDYKIDFDNTIRVSHVLSDETFNNSIFKFSAEDYYNIPTDRGIIVNLFTIGSNIFVHTKTAFYKFDGNQTITASNTDITLQESEPFETGITQLFDSEYGYGGIYNKEAGCITFDSYIFYDAMSNHIFAYGGNSQVQLIDFSIYKLLCYYKPTYCRTLHDDANHRVFFEFTTDVTTGDYKTFTISYNYKAKSFVSLHDLSLEKTFHSRYLSYSYKNDLSQNGLSLLFEPTKTIDNTVISSSMNIYKIYGKATTICFIQFGADTQEVQSSPFNIAVIVFPQENYRECLNNLKYIGDVIQDNYIEKHNYEVIKFPQITRVNPVDKFYVITDRCVSTPVTGTIDDTRRFTNPNNYKGFKYDMGSWNTNYFRNAIDANNVYQYPDQPGVDEPIAGGQTYTRNPNTDNNSLIYGKYFILVFNFIKNRPIKFEEVIINSNKY